MPSNSEAAMPPQEALARQLPLSPWLSAKGMDWSELLRGHTPEWVPKGTSDCYKTLPSRPKK